MRWTELLHVFATAAAVALAACEPDAPETPPVAVSSSPPKEAPATAAPPPAALACPHPYFPLAEGARWEHVVSGGRAERRVRSTVGRIARTDTSWRAPVEVRVGDQAANGSFECDAGGVFIDTGAGAFWAVGDLRVFSSSQPFAIHSAGRVGALLPPPSTFQVGVAWMLSLDLAVSIGDPVTKRATVHSQVRFQRLADERVRTTAGTFEAAHVRGDGTATEEAVLMGRTLPVRALPRFTLDLWLAEDVGLVRSVATQNDGGNRVESKLVSSDLPVL